MAKSFTDRIAEKVLADAISAHDGLVKSQAELQASHDALVADIHCIESELEQLADRPFSGSATSLAEIEAQTLSQENKRTELQQQLEAARLKLRLVDDSRTKTFLELNLAVPRVREARCTMAAGHERWLLSQKPITEGIKAFNEIFVVWDSALGGLELRQWIYEIFFDNPPTERQHQAARELLKFPDE